jgi:hypothetical protein
MLRRFLEKTTTFMRRKTLPPDESRSWIGFANPGMLDPGNVYLFDYCVRNLPGDAAVVEIGSFCGLSLNHLVYFLRKYNRRNPVFSADAWEFEGFAKDSRFLEGTDIEAAAYRQHVMDTFRSNVTLFSADRLPHHIQASSDAFFEAWAEKSEWTDFFGRPVSLGGPIALAYIDGDHSYEQSLKDFENVDRHLEVGGA